MGSKKPDQRGPRTTQEQRAFIIDYMYAHRRFAHGQFDGPLGAGGLKKQWKRLVAGANDIEGGNAKTVVQYQRLWADIKKRAKAKAVAILRSKNDTGHFEKEIVLDILDRKVLTVMGRAAVEGIPNTRDSLPESTAALLRLMAGDRSTVNADEPSTLFATYGICDPIDQPTCGTALIDEKSRMSENKREIAKERQDIAAEFQDAAEWDDMSFSFD